MKTCITVLLFLALSITGLAQNLDGSWKGKMSTPNGDMDLTFTFKVDADSLTGNVESNMGTLPIVNGKVDGNKFTFDVDVNGQVIHHTGVLDSNEVKLTLPFSDQPMILSRVSEGTKIDGKWTGTINGPQGETQLYFTFKVDGDKLAGSDSSSMGNTDISNGVVKGNEFSFDIEMNGMKISHECKYMDNDTIDMVANVMDQKMDMKLTRAAK